MGSGAKPQDLACGFGLTSSLCNRSFTRIIVQADGIGCIPRAVHQANLFYRSAAPDESARAVRDGAVVAVSGDAPDLARVPLDGTGRGIVGDAIERRCLFQ